MRVALILITLFTFVQVSLAEASNTEIVYFPVNRATLAQLYWRMDQLDLNNDTDIDNFLMLNKCALYEDKFHNEFEWFKIREKARASLAKNKDQFSRHFQIIQPIYLRQYDVQNRVFPLFNKIDTAKFELKADDDKVWDCRETHGSDKVWRYPHETVLNFARPLQIADISVSFERAQTYFNKYSNYQANSPRPAFLVKKFRVFEVNPFHSRGRMKNKASISAILEEYEIWGDKEKTLLLYKVDTRRKKLSESNN